MKRLFRLARLVRIQYVLLRHGLDEVVLATHLLRPVRFLMYFNPFYWIHHNTKAPRAVRIRCAFEDLGPIFVKMGQLLSTRRDLLPDDIAEELKLLQDRVQPFDPVLAREMVEKAFGQSVQELFAYFDPQPLASASIAQVHAATLKNGKDVIVKILRPNIEKIIQQDIDLLALLADLAHRYSKEARRLRPREVVAEIAYHLREELDLMREAANASQLKRNFQDSDLLHIPQIYWEYSKKNILVQERIYGIPISDIAALDAHGINRQVLAERGAKIFFTQVFRDSFFHADMHAGNIFVSLDNPETPQYIAVDFGIMGTLSPADQRYLAENLLAFLKRDYRAVAELHVESGWVPASTRVDELEGAIRTVCEPLFERSLKDISFGFILLRLFQTARRFDMQIQPQLVLLQKTLLNVEGLGRQLYPDLDLWKISKPFFEQWLKDRVSGKSLWQLIKKRAPHWILKLPELTAGMPHQTKQGSAYIEQSLKQLTHQLQKQQKQYYWILIGSLFAGAAGLSLVYDPVTLWQPWLGSGFGLGSALSLLWAWK